MGSVLVMGTHGDGVPIAFKLASEGHIVKVYIDDVKARTSLQGFKNPSLTNNLGMLEKYDLIVYDMVGLGSKADKMIEQGHLVLGGSTFNDSLELDREYGEEVAEKLMACKVPKGPLVKTSEELVKELEKANSPMVIKPLDNKTPGLTLVSSNKDNKTLLSLAKSLGNQLIPCILQEKIDGIEISTEGWFNGEDWTKGAFNHTMEFKRFMEGDRGSQTGCMGNIVWACDEDELVKRLLLPLRPLLGKVGYVGPLDVNSIVTEKEVYFLEFTARPGYDAIQAYSELLIDGLFKFLWRVAIHDSIERVRNDYAIGVRLSMPPYPSDDVKKLKGAQVLELNDGARSHCLLSDVKLDDGVEVMAGVDGVIGCVTARGATIQEVRRRVYRTIRNIVIHDDVQYRSDIGAGVDNKIGTLKMWEWLDA